MSPSLSTLLLYCLAKEMEVFQPAFLRIVLIGIPRALALDATAPLVEWAANLVVSIPAASNTLKVQRDKVSLEIGPNGLI